MATQKPDTIDVATDTYWGLLVLLLAGAFCAVVVFAPQVVLAATAIAAVLYLSYRIGHRWLGFSRIDGDKHPAKAEPK